MIKPRRMRWAENVSWTVRGRRDMHSYFTKETVGKPTGRQNNIKMYMKQDDVVWWGVL
jgi:hypothetical protein